MAEHVEHTKTDELAGKYITFSLDGEHYGVRITKIREIIGMMKITPVPQTPEFVLGVINLRGQVIPVIDLRQRFHLPSLEATDRTPIIVVELIADNVQVQMGIMVDSVSEVLHATEDSIADTPSFGVEVDTDFILGMARGEQLHTLLDIDQVLMDQTVQQLYEGKAGGAEGT